VRLLVTRPEPEAQRTAEILRKLGHDVLIMPMLCIETVEDADLGAGPWDALIMTSANAARALAAHPRRAQLLSLRVFAVGRRTGEAARAAGFAHIISADGDASALAQRVVEDSARSARLLYLAGEDRSDEPETTLTAHGLDVRTVKTYRAVPCATLSAEGERALRDGRIDGILHFSQRSAWALINAARAAGLLPQMMKTRHYCLSAQVAAGLEGLPVDAIGVAARPDEPTLIALVPNAR
jgi:uroporphyrinogen-III synthase